MDDALARSRASTHHRHRQYRAPLLLGLVPVLLCALTGPGRHALGLPERAALTVLSLVFVSASATATALWARRALHGLRSGEPALSAAALFTASLACWTVGEVCSAWVRLAVGGDPRTVPAVVVWFLLPPLLAPVGLVLAARAAHPGISWARTALDGVLAGVGVFVVLWLVAFGPLLARHAVSGTEVVFSAVSTTGVVALAAAALTLAARCRLSPSTALMTAGALLLVVAHTTLLLQLLHGGAAPGGWVAVGSTAALSAFAAAAVVDRATGAVGPPPRPAGALAGLPHLPLAVAVPWVLVTATQQRLGPVEVVGTGVLIAAVLVRQGAGARENARLARELQARSDALETLAFTDPLTGLANRAAFSGALSTALDRSATGGSAVVLAFCDLDGFKGVNDRHGHAEGDALLVTVARRLEQVVRRGDVVARLGGDEFAVVVPRADPGPAAAEELRERILTALAAEPAVAASVGVASSTGLGTSGATRPADLLREADRRMYATKRVRSGPRAGADDDLRPAGAR